MSHAAACRLFLFALLTASCAAPTTTGPGGPPAAASAPAQPPTAADLSVVIATQDMLETRAEGGIATFEDGVGPAGAGNGIQVTFADKPTNFWDVEIAAHGLAVQPGPTYRISFWAKADAPRPIFVDVSNDGEPWNDLGFTQSIALTTEWKKHELLMQLRTAPTNAGRVCFKLGQSTAPVYLAGFQMQGPAGSQPAAAAAEPKGAERAWQKDLVLRQEPGNATVSADAGPAEAAEAIKVTFNKQPNRFWDVELIAHDLAVRRGSAYKVTFWAKAASPRALHVDVSQDGPPYSAVGVTSTIPVGPTWKKHEFVFVADNNALPTGRAVFKMGHTAEPLWIAGFSFAPADPKEVPVIDRTKVVDSALPLAMETRVQQTIAKVRQGPMAVTVLDAAGKPIAGATVKVTLKKHGFLFGQTLPHHDWSPAQLTDWQKKFLSVWEPLTTLVVPENSTKGQFWNASTLQARSIWELAKARGLSFKSHAPIWGYEFTAYRKETSWDCAKMEADIDARLKAELAMFKGHHAYSDLANEMVSDPAIQDACGGEQKLIAWYKRAHEIDPALKLTVNDYEQMHGRGTRVDDLVKRFNAAGASVAVQGEQFHDRNMWYPPEEVWKMLDRMARNRVEVHLTEITQPDDGSMIQGDYVKGVVWNSSNQAAYLRQTYRLAFGHPGVAAIVMWNLWDGASWLPRGGIVERNFTPKPAYTALSDLLTREWTTALSLTTDHKGSAKGRGFYGTYQVAVSHGGKTQVFTQTLVEGAPTTWTLRLP